MSKHIFSMEELLLHPHVQPFVSQAAAEQIAVSLEKSAQASTEPLYLRILVGVGAWFATIFLLLFLGMSGIIRDETGAIVFGILSLAAAIVIERAARNTFLNQLSLALAFAGNILLLSGAAATARGDEIVVVFLVHAVVCAVMYPLYANSTYRFLAPTALAALATTWIIHQEAFRFIHVLIGAEMLLAGILLLQRKRPPLLVPLAYASAAMLPATLLFMNLLQMRLWRNHFSEPLWLSSLLLAGGLIALFPHLAGGSKRLNEPWLLLAIASAALLGIFTTPGILVAIGLLVIGHAIDDRMLTALAYLFLTCFLVCFYYALNVNLAYKSYVVAGSGLFLLFVRWLLTYLEHKEEAA